MSNGPVNNVIMISQSVNCGTVLLLVSYINMAFSNTIEKRCITSLQHFYSSLQRNASLYTISLYMYTLL